MNRLPSSVQLQKTGEAFPRHDFSDGESEGMRVAHSIEHCPHSIGGDYTRVIR